jgi:regulator of sirC expression with transglutaminase-like and TPR domain
VRLDLLERFAVVVGASDTQVPIFAAALAYSAALQDGDVWPGAAALQAELEQQVLDHCADLRGEVAVAEGVLEFMAASGFVGDRANYEQVANSLMDRVLERRRGLPITLGALAMQLAGRCGIRLDGIAFPGHFLVGMQLDSDDPQVWDPFQGGIRVGPEQLAQIYASVVGQAVEPNSPQLRAHLQPAHSRLILTRMLENVRRHYTLIGERGRVADVLELLAVLHPEVVRIRELLDEQPRRRDLLN